MSTCQRMHMPRSAARFVCGADPRTPFSGESMSFPIKRDLEGNQATAPCSARMMRSPASPRAATRSACRNGNGS